KLLDLGCGDGVLTFALQEQCAQVVGVDKSPAMVEAARERGCKDVRLADGAALQEAGIKPDEFDIVFSNDALQWMKADPGKVVREIHQCLKPGGVLIAKFPAHHSISAIHAALIAAANQRGYDGVAISPWYYPTAEEYRAVLEDNWMHVHRAEIEPVVVQLSVTLRVFLESIAYGYVAGWADAATQKEILDEVERAVE
ncbi:S-adenosyl-L-methionine-dependent methyltransferase, partial [Dimargaris cristalligena]